jgi:hypothetical protein
MTNRIVVNFSVKRSESVSDLDLDPVADPALEPEQIRKFRKVINRAMDGYEIAPTLRV